MAFRGAGPCRSGMGFEWSHFSLSGLKHKTMKKYIWKLRALGRIGWIRKMVQSVYRLLYQEDKEVIISTGPLKGLKWKCRKGEQFYMPMGVYEQETAAWLSKVIESGHTYIDIGANSGYFTLLGAKLVTENGCVVAFEPVPEIYQSVVDKVALNDFLNVTVESCVVGDVNCDSIRFVIENNGANSHIEAINTGHFNSNQNRVIETSMVSLQSYCSKRKIRPDVLKIDVEGAEALVLRGISELIIKCRPRMIISTHTQELKRECQELLESYGFEVSSLGGFSHELIV